MRLTCVRLLLWCGLTLLLLARPWTPAAAGIEASDLAVADRVRQQAAANLERVAAAATLAGQWHMDRARARLRLADRQEAVAQELAVRRRELAAVLVTLGPLVRRDRRAGLLLAGLARAVAMAAARAEQLAAEGAALARQQRAATMAKAMWACRLAGANGAGDAAGRRWRSALRASVAAIIGTESTHPPASVTRGSLVARDRTTLTWAAMVGGSLRVFPAADHKRAISLDERLDRRLLRRQAAGNAARPDARMPGVAAARADPLLPIAGVVLAATSPGLVIATNVDQVVSTPVSGRVMFAEAFRGLGPLLIIDRGGGYHVVLSGLTRLDVRRGASVVAGQSVGEIAAREDAPARLHFELRYRGLPIDPAPWLAAYQDKVRS